MCCSFCGKEIGAFRLLRDSEFCSALHRLKYGERLGKALQEIAAPEPAPAGMADFLVQLPFQTGSLTSTLIPWRAGVAKPRFRTRAPWPFSIDISDAASDSASHTASHTATHTASDAQGPPLCRHWMPAPAAEPVSSFLQSSAALVPARTLRTPAFPAQPALPAVPETARRTFPLCGRWMNPPAPEPVSSFVQSSAALVPAWTVRVNLPCFDTGLVLTSLNAARLPGAPHFAAGPPPEPVARFVQCSVAFARVQVPRTLRSVGRQPVPQFAGELESLSAPDQPLAPPAMCRQWMPAPPADVVFSCVQPSSAPALAVPAALHTPAFGLCVAAPYVPCIGRSLAIPGAAEVMSTVRPSAALTPVVPIGQEAALTLPAIPRAVRPPWAAAIPASAPSPQAVESWLAATLALAPVSSQPAPREGAELLAPPAVLENAPALAKLVACPAAAPVESLMKASVARPMAATLRMLPFAVVSRRQPVVPSVDAQRLAPQVSQPAGAVPRLAVPHPIATIVVASPAPPRPHLESDLPHPGLLPIEFHTQRVRSALSAHPESRFVRPAVLPPVFQLRPALEKLKDPQQKAVRREPGFVGILQMPTVKRRPSVWMVAGRVAAGFLLVGTLWFGAASLRGNRGLMAHEEVSSPDAALSAANTGSSQGESHGAAPARTPPKGPVAWARHAIANRASLTFAENFRGMENWFGAAKGHADGWSRHPDGYMKSGALALYRPTLKFTDYHMEFFGQIESKSIGWTVRATDTRNYHAMKLTVVEAGTRPFVALVHYSVVDGKVGGRTQTPLNLMVHNNRPMQFAVDVRGNRFVTSIDGEEVDTYIESTLASGGVGFFSETGERARFYWMRISHNDDWLGHVCALLADATGTDRSASLWRLEPPAGTPAPGLPGERDGTTLAALSLGLPYAGDTRKAGSIRIWRRKPWNT